MAKKLRKKASCSNCDSTLSDDNYCPVCGQQNTTRDVEMGMLLRDFIDDFFSVDSRLFKTITPLLFKPGLLTVEYTSGRRVKYLPPLRMYLVISIVYFLIPLNPDEAPLEIKKDGVVINPKENMELNLLGNKLELNFDRIKNDTVYRDNMTHLMWLDSKYHWFFNLIGEQASKKIMEHSFVIVADKKRQDDFVGIIVANFPKMMFVLLPVFALLIFLFFWGTKPLYVETLVFSLHCHSFLFLLGMVSQLIEFIAPFMDRIMGILGFVLAILYLLVALRKVFRQSYGTILLKCVGIGFLYGICFMLAIATNASLALLLM